MWSVCNEITDQNYPEGVENLTQLQNIAHRLHPTRPVTVGCRHIEQANQSGFAQLLDVVGYNGGGACFRYEEDHKIYPDRKFIATEVPHTL